jgi:hypothetical protein
MYFLLFEMRKNVSQPRLSDHATTQAMHWAALKRQTWGNATVLLHISNGLFILLHSYNKAGMYGRHHENGPRRAGRFGGMAGGLGFEPR